MSKQPLFYATSPLYCGGVPHFCGVGIGLVSLSEAGKLNAHKALKANLLALA